jgi:putative transposase
MELMHNQVIRLTHDGSKDAYPSGLYRIVFDEPLLQKTVAVCIERFDSERIVRTGRVKQARTKNPRKAPPLPNIGELIWLERDTLERLSKVNCLHHVDIERESVYFEPLESSSNQGIYEQRVAAMAGFLDFANLQTSILVHKNLGALIQEAMVTEGVSRAFVYKQWSTLCRLGFDVRSLRPRRDRCGAPGVARPCDPGGRKKPGRKELRQRIAAQYGVILDPIQPGLTSEWKAAIIAADKTLRTKVKPRMSLRYKHIIDTAFVARYRTENQKLVPIDPKIGTYPTKSQVDRVLKFEVPRLQQLLQKTTTGHFNRALRGLTARNWKGLSGPGHTWAIDSSIADIYLRSSLNRAWIVGRPIVYIVVDVWSTAVVGFYVCLTGPSWNTARISLFNSVADPSLMGELWGYQPVLSLNPAPTLCYALMCDRGEYLSKKASLTAFKLIPLMSYAPPYRPDLKGLVEVLHRIEKDAQYLFVPGAMDHRRAEYDLRKSNPEESVLTVREYVHYLHELFAIYNLTADRRHRVDAHMAAVGVYPSPAGLWRWGHQMGVAIRRATPQADLITTLLDSDKATVRRNAVVFAGNEYSCQAIEDAKWTTTARNFGSWEIPINYYPGSVGRIWTPNPGNQGLLDLHISDQAKTSAEVTYDEMVDSFAFARLNQSSFEHDGLLQSLDSIRRQQEITRNATLLTREAEARASGAKPTMTEARIMDAARSITPTGSESHAKEILRSEEMESYEEMMRKIFQAKSEEEFHD